MVQYNAAHSETVSWACSLAQLESDAISIRLLPACAAMQASIQKQQEAASLSHVGVLEGALALYSSKSDQAGQQPGLQPATSDSSAQEGGTIQAVALEWGREGFDRCEQILFPHCIECTK